MMAPKIIDAMMYLKGFVKGGADECIRLTVGHVNKGLGYTKTSERGGEKDYFLLLFLRNGDDDQRWFGRNRIQLQSIMMV